jgi:hypothetical protein
MSREARWTRSRDQHRAALEAYAAAARALGSDRWTEPRSEGKWTPAQLTEHLTLSYRAFLQELRGGEPMRMRVSGFRLPLLRWLLLPHILFHRTFPRGAVAPRELRPAEGSDDAETALAELFALGTECELEIDAARARPRAVITHPYFGAIDAVRALRFQAVHLEHHTRQLRSAAAARA